MTDNYKHLTIEREPLRNDRRTRTTNIPPPEKVNLQAHVKRLSVNLDRTIHQAQQEVISTPDNYVLKLSYKGYLNFEHLDKHGVEFVSQES